MINNQHDVYRLSIRDFITNALQEDVGNGDHTSLACIDPESKGKAVVMMKEDGIVAGLVLADHIFNQVDSSIIVKVCVNEGSTVKKSDIVIQVDGSIRSILTAERLVLNCMQRMSGVATYTSSLVKIISGTNAKIMDTRKTTPNFRLFEKWAVLSGGGYNHRFGLYDMILIKDNHLHACGGIANAIKKANEYIAGFKIKLFIEIEVKTIEEVREVLSIGKVQRIMMDNFSPEDLRRAVALIDHQFETEASGGITEENILDFAASGVDFISVGALTHSYKSLDINLKIIS